MKQIEIKVQEYKTHFLNPGINEDLLVMMLFNIYFCLLSLFYLMSENFAVFQGNKFY